MGHDIQEWSPYCSPQGNGILERALNIEEHMHHGFVVKASRNAAGRRVGTMDSIDTGSDRLRTIFREFSEWKPLGGVLFNNGHYSEYFGGRCNYGEIEINAKGVRDVFYIYGNSLPGLVKFIRGIGGWPFSRIKTLIIGNTDHSLLELCYVARINPEDLHSIFDCSVIYAVNNDTCCQCIFSLPIGLPPIGSQEIRQVIVKETRKDKVLVILKPNTQPRVEAIKICLRYPEIFKVYEERIPTCLYYDLLSRYSHVLCLPGQGLDTYRIWESLALGCTPICPRIKPLTEFVGEHNCFTTLASMHEDCKLILLRSKHYEKKQLLLNEEDVVSKIIRSQKILEQKNQ